MQPVVWRRATSAQQATQRLRMQFLWALPVQSGESPGHLSVSLPACEGAAARMEVGIETKGVVPAVTIAAEAKDGLWFHISVWYFATLKVQYWAIHLLNST